VGARKSFGPLLFGGNGPQLGFGAWAVGGSDWGEGSGPAEPLAAIRLAFERGVTFFDTAPSYGAGESERLLGRAFGGAARDRVRIATKTGPRDDPQRSLEDSLRRLGTEYVDLVQLHELLDGWERRLETLHRLVDSGKARALGVCNATPRQLRRALEIAPVVACQDAYNLFDRDVEQRLLPLAREAGLAFLAYRPLAAGLLGGEYDAPPIFPPGDHRQKIYWFKGAEFARRRRVIDQLRAAGARVSLAPAALALRWLLAREGVTVVLAGARNTRQVEANVAALQGPLPDDLAVLIDQAVAAAFRLPVAGPDARQAAADWGARERFIVDRLDGDHSAEAIAAEWSDDSDPPLVAAQVKVFVDGMVSRGLLTAEG
jgi:aryl-alcohol dehydrogenase-like predicted oxidoreductase